MVCRNSLVYKLDQNKTKLPILIYFTFIWNLATTGLATTGLATTGLATTGLFGTQQQQVYLELSNNRFIWNLATTGLEIKGAQKNLKNGSTSEKKSKKVDLQ